MKIDVYLMNFLYFKSIARNKISQTQQFIFQTIEKNLSKLRFYFGTTDGWCPVSYYENLRKKCPQADAILCPSNIKHAFVISSSHDMADLISKWIKEDK